MFVYTCVYFSFYIASYQLVACLFSDKVTCGTRQIAAGTFGIKLTRLTNSYVAHAYIVQGSLSVAMTVNCRQ